MQISIHSQSDGSTNPTARRTDALAKDSTTGGSSARGTGAGGDRVTLTDSFQNLKSVLASLENTPVVNTQRVEEVRNRLSDGTYLIDGTRIADKMIQFEREFSIG